MCTTLTLQSQLTVADSSVNLVRECSVERLEILHLELVLADRVRCNGIDLLHVHPGADDGDEDLDIRVPRCTRLLYRLPAVVGGSVRDE